MLQQIDLQNLLNGVSRQPDNIRLSSQAEQQVNAVSDIVQGLRKRPGLEHIAALAGPAASASFHVIDRDPNRRFILGVSSGAIRAWNLNTGAEVPITNEASVSYLNFTGSSNEAFRFLTVADYTFVVNTQVVPAMSAISTGRPNYSAMIFFKDIRAGQWHEVFINGVLRASVPSNEYGEARAVVSGAVSQILNSFPVFERVNWIVRDIGSNVVYIERLGGLDFTLRTNQSNSNIVVIKERIQEFSSLPARGVDGMKINVIGNSNNQFDDYWVRYSSKSDQESGVWEESNAHDLLTTINKATMPHAIVIDPSGTSLTFKQLDWGTRNVGDEKSAPIPSFVGNPITDVFFFRNRLGFVADENVVMSEAGEFFNFFATTVTDLLDSDPIDVATSHTKVTPLKRAVPVSERLVLLSDRAQFFDNIANDDLLTPKTAAFKAKSEYEGYIGPANTAVAKTTLFFPQRNKEWSRMWEMIPDADKNPGQDLAIDVTEHVPDYLPNNIREVVYHQGTSSLYILSDLQPRRIYIYRWLIKDNKRVQASWSYWEFVDPVIDIRDMFVVDNWLYVVRTVGSSTDYRLGRIDLENQGDFISSSQKYHIHLDNKMLLTGVYDAVNNWTTWTLPVQWATTVPFVVIRGPSFSSLSGIDVNGVYRSSTTQVRAPGNHTEADCFLGTAYSFRYQFSRLYWRDGEGQAVEDGRTACKSITLYLKDTGYLKAIVSRAKQSDRIYEIGVSVGNSIRTIPLQDFEFRVPLYTKNENLEFTLESDSPYPLQVTKARAIIEYTNIDRSV